MMLNLRIKFDFVSRGQIEPIQSNKTLG